MTYDDLVNEIKANTETSENEMAIISAVDAYLSASNGAKPIVISCADFQRFIDAIAQKAEYISGKQYQNCYEGLMIPVIEYNEILAVARNVLNIDVS